MALDIFNNTGLSLFASQAPLDSPTFTGTVTIPTPFTLGAVSVLATGTELNYVDGVTSAIQTQLDLKAPLASPTFTGTVTTGLLKTNTTSYAMVNSVNTALTRISGGTSDGDNGAQILLFGSGHANTGRFAINTSGVGSGFADTERLQISGGVATAVATWASVTHTGLVITSAGLVEGAGTGANGFKIKNPKNAAATALSGTQLDVEIDIGGTPYYFTVYPTKA